MTRRWRRTWQRRGRIPSRSPDYAGDVHTAERRWRDKTRADFFRDEHNALSPREPGLFDDLVK